MALPASPPRPISLLTSWLRVSLQSFGGGTATLALIRREFVQRGQWITEQQFMRDWSLCQLAPGINLIALTILIGKRTGGALAIVIGLCGLLLPSFAITLALTAAYAKFIHSPVVSGAMKGVIPAVAGIGLATAFGMASPIAKNLWAGQRVRLLGYGTIFACCAGAYLAWHLSTVAVVLGAGVMGGVFNTVLSRGTGAES